MAGQPRVFRHGLIGAARRGNNYGIGVMATAHPNLDNSLTKTRPKDAIGLKTVIAGREVEEREVMP